MEIIDNKEEEIHTLEKGFSSIIKNELGYILSIPNINIALNALGISANNVISYQDIDEFSRRGGETYGAVFEIIEKEQNQEIEKKFFVKAIVRSTPKDLTTDFKNRREKLMELGIPVSNWYYANNSLIIEDFYPFNYEKTKDIKKLIQIGYKLDSNGFQTKHFLSDIRCDNAGKPYYVDFGEDLGENVGGKYIDAKKTLLKSFPDDAGIIISYYEKGL